MERVRIEIDVDGNPVLSVSGVKGKSCQDLTRDLERALGTTVQDKPTGEMYEQPLKTKIMAR